VSTEIIKAKKIVGGKATGTALVTSDSVCFMGGVDVEKGVITERGHDLAGTCMADQVLVYPTGKGSTGGSYMIYEAAANGVAPAAIVNMTADPVTVVGCTIAEIPMVAYCDRDPVAVIKTGDLVTVDADAGTVIVEKGEVQS
jgi:uncharacterized protein